MRRPRSSHENRTLIADWTTVVFAIFWSVWWGLFIDKVLDLNGISIPIGSSKDHIYIPIIWYLLYNALVVSVYTVTYVRWLIKAQKTASTSVSFRDFAGFSVSYVIVLAVVVNSIMLVLYSSTEVPYTLLNYGILLTVAWPIVMFIILWPDQ